MASEAEQKTPARQIDAQKRLAYRMLRPIFEARCDARSGGSVVVTRIESERVANVLARAGLG